MIATAAIEHVSEENCVVRARDVQRVLASYARDDAHEAVQTPQRVEEAR